MDTNINVLVADDYNTMLRIVRTFLRQIAFKNIPEDNNGEETLKSYAPAITAWLSRTGTCHP